MRARWTVGWRLLLALALLIAPVASADDRGPGQPQGCSPPPREQPNCYGRSDGDPCNRASGLCGTCRSGSGLYCINIHECTEADGPGCSSTAAVPPATAVTLGLLFLWSARRRRRP